MPARKLYFESVRVGDELPALAKAPVDRVQLARYAGRVRRLQPACTSTRCTPRAWACRRCTRPACWSWACWASSSRDWARGGQLRGYDVRFIKMVWPGDTVVCKGRVTRPPRRERPLLRRDRPLGREPEGRAGDEGQRARSSSSTRSRTRTGSARARPPVVVDVPRESILAARPQPPPQRARPAAKAAKPRQQARRPTREKPAAKKAAADAAKAKAKRREEAAKAVDSPQREASIRVDSESVDATLRRHRAAARIGGAAAFKSGAPHVRWHQPLQGRPSRALLPPLRAVRLRRARSARRRYEAWGADEAKAVARTRRYRFAREVLGPLNVVGDREGCKLEDGQVITPTGFKDAWKKLYEAGWKTRRRRPRARRRRARRCMLQVLVEEMLSRREHRVQHVPRPRATARPRSSQQFGTPEQQKQLRASACSTASGAARCASPSRTPARDVGAAKTTRDEATPTARYKIQRHQDLHLRRRSRPRREHHPPRARAHRRRARRARRASRCSSCPKLRVNADGTLGEPNDVTVGVHRAQDGHQRLGDLRAQLRRERRLRRRARRRRRERRA